MPTKSSATYLQLLMILYITNDCKKRNLDCSAKSLNWQWCISYYQCSIHKQKQKYQLVIGTNNQANIQIIIKSTSLQEETISSKRRMSNSTDFDSKGMIRKPEGSSGASSGNISSIGAKTSSEQAPMAFSSTPLHICRGSLFRARCLHHLVYIMTKIIKEKPVRDECLLT